MQAGLVAQSLSALGFNPEPAWITALLRRTDTLLAAGTAGTAGTAHGLASLALGVASLQQPVAESWLAALAAAIQVCMEDATVLLCYVSVTTAAGVLQLRSQDHVQL